MKMKIIGTVLAFGGGIVGFVSSIAYFFSGPLMTHFDYNSVQLGPEQTTTALGILLFLITLVILFLALLAFKHHYSKKLFITLIILGAILCPFGFFLAGLLTLAGGIFGLIGIMTSPKAR